jgi:hypothetical protein
MGSDEDRPANLYERSHRWLLPIVRSDLIHRPGDGTSHRAEVVLRCPNSYRLLLRRSACRSLFGRK